VRSVDLFAGPGGWDLAASTLGVDVTGVELDGAACATRHAAGLKTVQGDVAELAPGAFGPVEMLIASPPCPTFSSAGKGSGRGDMSLILSWVLRVAAGEPLDALRAAVDDARSRRTLRWSRSRRASRSGRRSPASLRVSATGRGPGSLRPSGTASPKRASGRSCLRVVTAVPAIRRRRRTSGTCPVSRA
jgi:hypothetical protein